MGQLDIEGGDTRRSQFYGSSSAGAVLAALGIGLCPMCFGFTMGFTGTALEALVKPPMEGGTLTDSEAAAFTAAVTLAAAGGSLIGGPMADRWGRKRALTMAMVVCAAGFVLVATGRAYQVLLTGRVLSGLAIGAVSVATPLYLSEISPAHLRSALGSTMQLSIVLGLLLVFVVGYEAVPTRGWRYLAKIGAVVPTCFVLLVAPMLPESPRWLAASEYPDRVEDSLRLLRGCCAGATTSDRQVLEAAIADESAEMIRNSKPGQSRDASSEVVANTPAGGIAPVLGMLLTTGDDARALRNACAVMSLQQLSGINAVNMFASTILSGAGIEDAQAATIWIAATQCVSAIVCMFTSDWLSIRGLLAASALGMAIGAAVLSVCVQSVPDAAVVISTEKHDGAPALGCSSTTSVAALVFYVFSFGVGVGPLAFVIVSTTLSLKIRTSGQALATTLNWIFAFVVTRTFGWLVAALGKGGVFQLFAAVNLSYSIFATQLPDTAAPAANSKSNNGGKPR